MTSPSSQKLKRERTERMKALRQAWPYRHGLRGRIVVQVSVARLRQLRKES